MQSTCAHLYYRGQAQGGTPSILSGHQWSSWQLLVHAEVLLDPGNALLSQGLFF